VENSNNSKYSGFFSKKLRAGKRRTYFFDVRSTKQNDFFLTITESKKRFEGDGYDSHKIFLYKEDFKKFLEALQETVEYIKTELMPDYDYESERPVRSIASEEGEHNDPSTEPREKLSDNPNSSIGNGTPQISDDEEMEWK
jgi:hypothetical protein